MYTKEELLKILEYALAKYPEIEITSFWKDEYVGSCSDKLEIKKNENGYEVKVYTAIC